MRNLLWFSGRSTYHIRENNTEFPSKILFQQHATFQLCKNCLYRLSGINRMGAF